MLSPVRIALVGDYRPSSVAHQAIPLAIELAAASLNIPVNAEWLPTESITSPAILENFAAIWLVPGGPYQNSQGAFLSVTYARKYNIPFLGSCAGFQYAVVEYARNVMGWTDAAHAEMDTEGRMVITPLTCSLVEKTGDVVFKPGSLIANAYGKLEASEGYHCNFGINPEFVKTLSDFPLQITAWDREGDVRGIELPKHKYFVATLFQSERSALRNSLSPLVVELINATRR